MGRLEPVMGANILIESSKMRRRYGKARGPTKITRG